MHHKLCVNWEENPTFGGNFLNLHREELKSGDLVHVGDSNSVSKNFILERLSVSFRFLVKSVVTHCLDDIIDLCPPLCSVFNVQ